MINETIKSNLFVAPVVVDFDMVKVGGVLERWIVPVQITQPSVDLGVPMSDSGEVALMVSGTHSRGE